MRVSMAVGTVLCAVVGGCGGAPEADDCTPVATFEERRYVSVGKSVEVSGRVGTLALDFCDDATGVGGERGPTEYEAGSFADLPTSVAIVRLFDRDPARGELMVVDHVPGDPLPAEISAKLSR